MLHEEMDGEWFRMENMLWTFMILGRDYDLGSSQGDDDMDRVRGPDWSLELLIYEDEVEDVEDEEEVVDADAADPARGLCHLRWDARFAGQLKTFSHSVHRYSTWTIRGHRCWARRKASKYFWWHKQQT